MCLLIFALHEHPDYPLVLCANRDEFFARPTAPAQFWADQSGLLAGRDLRSGGTWLGCTRTGRVAALTNFREGASSQSFTTSRGQLVQEFLQGEQSAADYVEALQARKQQFGGFNLLVADGQQVWYSSNRQVATRQLTQGLFGISNALLDTPWPKLVRGKAALKAALNSPQPSEAALLQLMADTHQPADALLPSTGVGLHMERVLAPAFIAQPDYGTRCTTVLTIHRSGAVRLTEKRFSRSGDTRPSEPPNEPPNEHDVFSFQLPSNWRST